jgi:hypothetical protein
MCLSGSSAQDDAARRAQVKQLYAAQKWQDLARAAQGPPGQPADFDYYEGMALARLERWSEARDSFSRGLRKLPSDTRFLTERAAVEYKLNDYRAAKRDLRSTLRLDPKDSYALDFLGTIYLLEGNLEAALRYWNRVEKPKLASVAIAPAAKTQRALLDRAVTFSPPGTLRRDAFLETTAWLENLNVFPRWRVDLAPADSDEAYDATLRLNERTGYGPTLLTGAVALLSGVPYETVYPSYYGIRGEAINFDSLLRWDSQKRRACATLEFPLFRQPAKRLRIFFDTRNENWNLSQTFFAPAVPVTGLNVRRFAGGAELDIAESGWWGWAAGAEALSREFQHLSMQLPHAAWPFFTDSTSLDAWLSLDRWLLRIPERRFTIKGTGEVRGGRNYGGRLGAFGGIKGEISARWLPQAHGDDYEFVTRLRGADTFADVPLDMLYQLGVERDNDLWLRGHAATTDGQKGRAPLGRRYVLLNSELYKTVYDAAFFRVQVGPFFDSGAIADPTGLFGSQKWLYDTGIQARIRVLGSVSVVLSYGRDLRNGQGAFYTTALH